MNKKTKLILSSILILSIIVGSLFTISQGQSAEVFTVAAPSTLRDISKESGNVVSSNVVSIVPSFEGQLNIIVDLGDEVKKGEVIAEVDATDINTAIKQLEGQIMTVEGQKNSTGFTNPQSDEIEIQKLQIETQKRDYQKALDDFEKSKTIFNSGGISKSEIDQLENGLMAMKNQLKISETNLKTLKSNRESMSEYFGGQLQSLISQKKSLEEKKAKAKILSPITGVVTSVISNDGSIVNQMSPILEISENQNNTIKSNVAAEVAAELKLGEKVELIYDTKNSGYSFEGEIVKISGFANTQISTLGLEEKKVEVEISSEQLYNIPIGYKIDINYTTLNKPNVISIPKLSTFKIENEDYVFKLENRKVKKQLIKKGIETSDKVEVIEGLLENDIIILDPNNKNIKEGTKIK